MSSNRSFLFRMLRRHHLSLIVCVLIAVNGVCQPRSGDQDSSHLDMLVLGDSIVWGQGLKPERKSWYLVKRWLETTTGKTVRERIAAHSGALIEPGETDDKLSADNGEVNVARPTLNDQIDAALKYYANPADVDVILLSACGNDVGVENLLNAGGAEEINEMTEKKCGPPMERLLRRIGTTFPSAVVVVVGYYPFFSEKTRNDFVLQGLTKRFVKVAPGARRLNRDEILTRLTSNSQSWYAASNKALAGVVEKINGEFGRSSPHIVFAKIDFPADYSFAAKETRLWQFNRSPLRMMMLFLSFGRMILPANDEVRNQRTASCKEVFKAQSVETTDQRKERQKRMMLCRYASLGHPNRLGATLYSEAIIAAMPRTVASR